MTNLIALLEGRKTYFVSALFGGLAFCYLMKWITLQDLMAFQALLNGAGFAALRSGMDTTAGGSK